VGRMGDIGAILDVAGSVAVVTAAKRRLIITRVMKKKGGKQAEGEYIFYKLRRSLS